MAFDFLDHLDERCTTMDGEEKCGIPVVPSGNNHYRGPCSEVISEDREDNLQKPILVVSNLLCPNLKG